MTQENIELSGLTDPQAAGVSGLPHAKVLTRFADAFVSRDKQALEHAREDLQHELGPACMVDAAGVAANFQRMVRIADGTGIPIDRPMQMMSEDLRAELGINDFPGAENTRPLSMLKRWSLRSLAVPMMRKVIGRLST